MFDFELKIGQIADLLKIYTYIPDDIKKQAQSVYESKDATELSDRLNGAISDAVQWMVSQGSQSKEFIELQKFMTVIFSQINEHNEKKVNFQDSTLQDLTAVLFKIVEVNLKKLVTARQVPAIQELLKRIAPNQEAGYTE